jgi:hypothetical protein
MVSEGSDNTAPSEQPTEPRECMACRGSGRVISKLGGETSTVPCPWCDGGGMRLPGHDAQERWASGQSQDPGGEAAAGEDAGSPAAS